jgi:vacuolar-type H+-ATPase subunit E/Vma4
MALAELLAALRREADARRERILAEADARVERIRASSAAVRERRRSETLAGVTSGEAAAARRAIAQAEAAARRSVLTARDELLGKVRASVGAQIEAAAADPTYLASLPTELARALARLPDGPVTVRARPELVPALSEALRTPEVGRGRSVRVARAPSMGVGFTAHSSDGEVEVDATLASRLDQAWPRLAVDVIAEGAP